jgi:hypothetical protein
MGTGSLRDVDLVLLDPQGSEIAHDTTNQPQATLRPCLDSADTYVLVIKAAAGAGPWLTATWSGGGQVSPASSAIAVGGPTEANGTCQAPIPLSPGAVTGSTTHGEHENSGSCSQTDSRELVYELDVPQRQRLTIEVEARFDSVLYLRKDDCTDANAEVACNDDAPDRTRSRIELVAEPGKYFVFVDGYGHEAGTFKLTVDASDVLALGDICRHPPALPEGVRSVGTTAGHVDDARASCGGGAQGADSVWAADLRTRSRVRLIEHSDEVAPVLHVRRSCGDELSEAACADSGAGVGEAAVVGVFEAGGYSVFADGHDPALGGTYTLLFETAPPAGSGVAGDGCGDAHRLPGGDSGSLPGDTFAARDDVSGSCGGQDAADVVYRLDISRRSRLAVWLEGEEAPHVVELWTRCGDRAGELACGRSLDEVVAPGSYYLGVDGASPTAFGRFTLRWASHDIASQAGACAHASALREGQTIVAALGSSNDFDAACAPAAGRSASGPDRVFFIDVTRPSDVHLTLKSPTFDAALALRRACLDAVDAPPVEMACNSEADSNHRVRIDRLLEPGRYWVVVDALSPKDQGPVSLELRAAPSVP